MLTPIRIQAKRLADNNIDCELIEEYIKIKDKCRETKDKCKMNKNKINKLECDISNGRLKLRGLRRLFLTNEEYTARRSIRMDIKIKKQELIEIRDKYKELKMKYKEFRIKRREIVRRIREVYKENKDIIKESLKEKREERRQKLIKAGIVIKEGVSDITRKVGDTLNKKTYKGKHERGPEPRASEL